MTESAGDITRAINVWRDLGSYRNDRKRTNNRDDYDRFGQFPPYPRYSGAVVGKRGFVVAHKAIALRACLEKRFSPLMGESLYYEYEDVVSRDALFNRCPLSRLERNQLLDAFFSVCQWVMIYYAWRPNLRDEADSHLIEPAVAGNAEYIVTQNIKDFQGPQLHFPELSILTPIACMKEVT